MKWNLLKLVPRNVKKRISKSPNSHSHYRVNYFPITMCNKYQVYLNKWIAFWWPHFFIYKTWLCSWNNWVTTCKVLEIKLMQNNTYWERLESLEQILYNYFLIFYSLSFDHLLWSKLLCYLLISYT
jgi:hypothetical protein